MKDSKLNRRQFLVTAGAGSAAAAATALIAAKPAAPAAEVVATADTTAKSKGYHLSAHIEKYYKTTEI